MQKEKQKAILIVDDEEIVHMTLTPFLSKMGYEVENAREGKSALAMMEERAFSVMLVDYRMPGMDGLSLLTKILKNDPKASVILMSGDGGEDIAGDAREMGAIAFFKKPFKLMELCDIIEKCTAK